MRLAILTAVFGTVAVILLVVLIVICRNKRRERGKEIEETNFNLMKAARRPFLNSED